MLFHTTVPCQLTIAGRTELCLHALDDQVNSDQTIFAASSRNLARPFSVRGWSSRPRMGLSGQVTTWAPASMQGTRQLEDTAPLSISKFSYG